MKKLLAVLVSASFVLSACGEKDEAYYLNNKDKAEEKLAECQKEFIAALGSKDKEKAEKVKSNNECNVAHKALRQIEKQEAEARRLAKEAERQAKIEEAKKAVEVKYANLDWQQAATQYVNSECSRKYVFEGGNDYACLAEQSVYEDILAKGKAELKQKHNFTELLGLEKQYCSADKRKYSVCYVWEQAAVELATESFEKIEFPELERQQKQFCEWGKSNVAVCQAWEKVYDTKQKAVVENYVKNPEILKQTYNQCVDDLKAAKEDWQMRDQLTSTYPCKQIRRARIQLQLDSSFENRME